MQRALVLYHAGCFDGFCAAWAAWRKLGDHANYIPISYGQPFPYVAVRGRDVYVLDFSYKRPIMEMLRKEALTLTVLDHHKTAEAELRGFGETGPNEETNTRCVFDMTKSGGRLAWEHFHRGKPVPWLVDYTEDRDLWLWKLPQSKEVNAALRSYPMDFEQWDRWSDDAFSAYILEPEGRAILRREQQIVDQHVQFAKEIEMGAVRVLAVNATVLTSEIAGALAKDRPFGACYFIRADGKKVWSLRSREDGMDVSEIAKRNGGGGHKHAAGFEE